ncbi:hypothetical protein [Candidatus Enterococcus mansonii]|uniref:Uncharacterized protein n=1 Tax=Candidatus Enterococcus mansonii TaxID=1834181 RepID=A0A242CCK0_9ENTE|nr:hypothetical protein [Enterococcus sp. 4G2_DIV0659]OTO07985.1 hypothetical protein A5880_002255 [Enterococcus sp. 4G2_DIV0659]
MLFGKKNPVNILSGGSWIFPKAKDNVVVSVKRGSNNMIGFSYKSLDKFFYLREIIMENVSPDSGKAQLAGAAFGAAKSLLTGGGLGDARSSAIRGKKLGKEIVGTSTAKLILFDPEENNEFQITIDCSAETHSMLSNYIVSE